MSKSTQKATNTKKSTPLAKAAPQKKNRAKGQAPIPSVVVAGTSEPAAAQPVPSEAPEPKKPPIKKDGKMSGLDAVAKVLAEATGPMNTKDMVETAAAKGYWSSGGKTPAATIYAAIVREITKKGTTARFKKTERGLFTLA